MAGEAKPAGLDRPRDMPRDGAPAGADRVTDDLFLGGALKILQPKNGYRAGLDAVLLAAAAQIGPDAHVRVADLGAGVGTVGLCLARRLGRAEVDLVEREPQLCALAQENVVRNGFAERARVVVCDLTGREAQVAIASNAYDYVVANPPFYVAGQSRPSQAALKAAAHIHGPDDLDLWVRCMARILKPSGRVSLIHTVRALDDILAVMRGRFGGLKIVPVYARNDDAAAIRCLVHGTKGSRGPLEVGPPLILHQDGRSFRPVVAEVLQGVQSLRHWPMPGPR